MTQNPTTLTIGRQKISNFDNYSIRFDRPTIRK